MLSTFSDTADKVIVAVLGVLSLSAVILNLLTMIRIQRTLRQRSGGVNPTQSIIFK